MGNLLLLERINFKSPRPVPLRLAFANGTIQTLHGFVLRGFDELQESFYMYVVPFDRPCGEPAARTNSAPQIVESLLWAVFIFVMLLIALW